MSPIKALPADIDQFNIKQVYNRYAICKEVFNATTLQYFFADKIPEKSINKIINLRNLKFIKVINCNIKDISPFTKFPKLVVLNLSCNKITDISPIMSLTIKHVILASNNIVTVNINKNTNIKSLDLRYNKIKNISCHEENISINTLVLSSNNITSINFLPNLKNIIKLYANDNSLINIKCINECPNLKLGYFCNNYITNTNNINQANKKTKYPIFDFYREPKPEYTKFDSIFIITFTWILVSVAVLFHVF